MGTIDKTLFLVHSITGAMRGQQLLERAGITALVQRNTVSAGKQGCGYALKVTGDAGLAARILSESGIPAMEIQRG